MNDLSSHLPGLVPYGDFDCDTEQHWPELAGSMQCCSADGTGRQGVLVVVLSDCGSLAKVRSSICSFVNTFNFNCNEGHGDNLGMTWG